MSIVSTASVPSKRMAGEFVVDIKKKWIKFGLPVFGNKGVLSEKLAKAEELVNITDAKEANDLWSSEEVLQFIAFLPADVSNWVPADVQFAYENFNTHACDPSTVGEFAQFFQDMCNYMDEHFSTTPRMKSLTVLADVLVPMMTTLARKKPAEWKQKHIDLLITHYGDVHLIDGANSDPAAVDQYCTFLGQLQEFYVLRPDLRAVIDPDVVVFDITNAVTAILHI